MAQLPENKGEVEIVGDMGMVFMFFSPDAMHYGFVEFSGFQNHIEKEQ